MNGSKDFRYFVGLHLPEICALSVTAATFVVGWYLAWVDEPAWLNRFGALITVIGVILAVWRYHERAAGAMKKDIAENRGNFIRIGIEALEKVANTKLSAEERIQTAMWVENLRHDPEFAAQIDEAAVGDIKRVKMWEVAIVIFGTLVNGFGDVVVTLAKSIA